VGQGNISCDFDGCSNSNGYPNGDSNANTSFNVSANNAGFRDTYAWINVFKK
jgi:hypothetical protein